MLADNGYVSQMQQQKETNTMKFIEYIHAKTCFYAKYRKKFSWSDISLTYSFMQVDLIIPLFI